MAKLTSILQERFKKKEQPKISELAEKRIEGRLTPFSGVFGMPRIDESIRIQLNDLLQKYANEKQVDLLTDLSFLLEITAEVKAITNQAAILHGERIKKAQEILKKYREGAFSAWLVNTYGNRQTPYNFLQYYEFHLKMPTALHSQIEAMPRQAVYTLASRDGPFNQKEEIVRNYKGEGKEHMISLIRRAFPLNRDDKRKENLTNNALKQLEQLACTFKQLDLNENQKKQALQFLQEIKISIS